MSCGATPELVVVKVGSSTLVDASGAPDRTYISSLCDQAAALHAQGTKVIIVSSGAAAAGVKRLGLDARPTDLGTLQACCAAGQAALTEIYAECLEVHGIPCGQVLLTRSDVMERTGYLNVRNTFDKLLELGAVPVVNENDTVSPTEINFGDNDTLGAIVSVLVGADLYVILSDIDGLHEEDPNKNPDAPLIPLVTRIDERISGMAGGSASAVGTGGMATKVRAARGLMSAGIATVICHGREEQALLRAAQGTIPGTRFQSDHAPNLEGSRKLWIGLAGLSKGSLEVDAGAQKALYEEGASLLPVGVSSVEGSFAAGDIVSVVNASGDLVGRGIVRYSSEEMEKIRGLKSDVVARFYPDRADQPCIHRDEMLVF